MGKAWFTSASIIGIICFFILFTATGCRPQENVGSESGDIEAFRAALEQAGFIVQEGAYGYQDTITLCSAGFIDNCQGANVGAPYLAYKLPPAPGQEAPNVKIDPSDGLAFAYHLQQDEAIVQIGYTPPEAGFFSYQSYLVMRYDPDRKQYMTLFNSIGDTINNLTINTQSTSTDKYSQPVIIISAADKRIDTMVRKAAHTAGYSQEIINTDIIPSSAVNMGLEEDTDLFGFVGRIGVPGDRNDLDAYIKNPGSVIFRLTPRKTMASKPFPVPELRVRGTGKTELDLLPAVEELRQAILAKYENLHATEIPTFVALPEGFMATQSKINTIGDNRDAAYFSTLEVDAWTKAEDSRRDAAFILPDDPDEFVIIYGVNHEATGKATYANCVVYGLQYLNGVAGVDSREYLGSADDYIPGHPQAQYLYAWKIIRKSNGDLHCLEVPVGPQRYGIEPDDKLILFFRAYLEKETKTGPAHNELVMDRVIRFSPK